jgi:hypothetical protein
MKTQAQFTVLQIDLPKPKIAYSGRPRAILFRVQARITRERE